MVVAVVVVVVTVAVMMMHASSRRDTPLCLPFLCRARSVCVVFVVVVGRAREGRLSTRLGKNRKRKKGILYTQSASDDM